MENKKEKKDKKFSIAFVKNSYSVVTIAVVIAIVVFANLILQQLVGSSLEFDMSNTEYYEISDITYDVLDGLEDEITVTVLADINSTDDLIVKFIERYAELSTMISTEWIDPVEYPSVLDTYGTTASSIIVECEATGKSTIISIGDMLYLDEMTYYYYGEYVYYFDGDGQFTSAVSQVTSDVDFTIYNVTGHGEAVFQDDIVDLMTKNSVTLEESFNLLTATEIPEDCDLLTFYGLETDITADEATLLTSYLEGGGKILVLLGADDVDMPNMEGILADYGLQVEDGYIADYDRAYQGNAYYIIPNLSVSGDMATDMSTYSVLIINSKGFTEITPVRDTISVSEFMTTSDNAVAVTEAGETSGTYMLGAVATEDVTLDDGTETETRLTVYGTGYIIDSNLTSSFSTLENTTLFMNSIMANFDGAVNVSIEPKLIEETYNIVSDPSIYGAIFIIVIPLSILVAGFVVWNKRRRK